MNILLDTHTFIWWDSHIAKLSQKALDICTEIYSNTICVN